MYRVDKGHAFRGMDNKLGLIMKRYRTEQRNAFTLLELLTVVTIIAVMMCLLLPAIAAVRRYADKNKAAGDAVHMVNAIKQYRSAYPTFPGQTQGDADRMYDNVALLHSVLIDALTNNPRKLYFSEVIESISNGVYADPWGRPFVIAVDESGDGAVGFTATCGTISFSTSVLDRVAVFSWGRNPSNTSDRIVSWIR